MRKKTEATLAAHRPRATIVAMPQFERVGRDYYMILVADLTGVTAPRLVEMRLVEDPRALCQHEEDDFIASIMQALGIDIAGKGAVALLVFDDRTNCVAAHSDVLASFEKRKRSHSSTAPSPRSPG